MLPPGFDAALWAEMALTAQDAGAVRMRDHAVRPLFRRQGYEASRSFQRVQSAVDRAVLEAILADVVRGLEDSVAGFEDEFGRVAEDELRNAATTAGVSLGMDPGVSFDIFNEAAVAWAKQRSAALIKDLNASTAEAMRGIFARGLEDGSSLETLSNDVQEAFRTWEHGDDLEATRAMRIARTETVSAQNAGILEGFDASGVVVGKTWQTLGDGAVRASHAAMDGTTVGLDSSFPNGLQFPGDPGGAADEIVNCRCTILPAIEGQ